MLRTRRLVAALGLVTTSIALAAGAALPAQASGAPGNQGTSIEDKLFPGQYLGNGGYKLAMQTDGNLVLYDRTRVCWASHTNGLRGTYLDYDDNYIKPPQVDLKNATYGGLGTWYGSYTWLHKNGNLSLNSRGEVWIGWKKWIHC